MKIAYLANVRVPSERAHSAQIVHMCQSFSKAGAEVTLVTNQRTTESLSTTGDYFSITPSFKMVRVFHGFLNPKWWWSFYLSEFIFSVSALFFISKGDFDVVYTRSEWVAFFLSTFVSHKKIIWESHEAKYNFAAKSVLHKGIKCVVISSGIKDFYLSKNVSINQILVADDAIDESFFDVKISKAESRSVLGLSHEDKIVMYIGGFGAEKGLTTLLEASSLLNEHKIKIAVIGGSETEVESSKSKYPGVIFLGSKPYAELKAHQRSADILIIPNSATRAVSAQFTSPLKLFAHIASGVPLVVSDVPSLRSVVGDTEVSFFKPDNTRSLAEVILGVFSQYEEHMMKASELAKRALKHTWTERAYTIINFIRS